MAPRVHVVMPKYRFMEIDLVNLKLYSVVRIPFRYVSLSRFMTRPFASFTSPEWINISVSIYSAQFSGIQCFLVGTGDHVVFRDAYRTAGRKEELYMSEPHTPQEWRDLYFCHAVAQFLLQEERQNVHSRPCQQLFAQIHGATNGFVMFFYKHQHAASESPPSASTQSGNTRFRFVYILHDYSYELDYSLQKKAISKFSTLHEHSPVYNNKRLHHTAALFTLPNNFSTDVLSRQVSVPLDTTMVFLESELLVSQFVLQYADVVVAVSQKMAKELATGDLQFPRREHICHILDAFVAKHKFYGITNGIDISALNPFDDIHLTRLHLHFPIIKAQRRFLDKFISNAPNEQNIDFSTDPKNFTSSPINPTSTPTNIRSIVSIKKELKKLLHDVHRLATSPTSPLFLFIGRFQHEKGIHTLLDILPHLKRLDARLIIMGQPNSFPLHQLIQATHDFSDFVSIIYDANVQSKIGTLVRAAADFLLHPSHFESFGLVAVEALLFGCAVVSTGVGGMAEFLVDRGGTVKLPHSPFNSSTFFNAYLFPLGGSIQQTLIAIEYAIYDYFHMSDGERDAWIWKWIQNALNLTWEGDRDGFGALDRYEFVYGLLSNNDHLT